MSAYAWILCDIDIATLDLVVNLDNVWCLIFATCHTNKKSSISTIYFYLVLSTIAAPFQSSMTLLWRLTTAPVYQRFVVFQGYWIQPVNHFFLSICYLHQTTSQAHCWTSCSTMTQRWGRPNNYHSLSQQNKIQIKARCTNLCMNILYKCMVLCRIIFLLFLNC